MDAIQEALRALVPQIEGLGVEVWIGGHAEDEENFLGVALPDQRGAVVSVFEGSTDRFEVTVHPDVDGCLPCTERLQIQGADRLLKDLAQIVLESRRNLPIEIPGSQACRIERHTPYSELGLFNRFRRLEPNLLGPSCVSLADCAMYVMYVAEAPVGVAVMLEDEIVGPVLGQVMSGRGDIVYALIIDPEHRGKGHGSTLVEALMPLYPKMAAMSTEGALNFWRTKVPGMTEYPAGSKRFLSDALIGIQHKA